MQWLINRSNKNKSCGCFLQNYFELRANDVGIVVPFKKRFNFCFCFCFPRFWPEEKDDYATFCSSQVSLSDVGKMMHGNWAR